MIEPDIWVVHPGINTGTGADRVSLEALGLALPERLNGPTGQAWRASALAALATYFTGQVPVGDWANLTLELTDRSTPAAPEVVLYPGTTPRAQARAKLSPERADNGR